MSTLQTEPVDVQKRGKIVFGARYLPTYYGGLSQYQRSLAGHLSKRYQIGGLFLGEGLWPGQQISGLRVEGWDFADFSTDLKWPDKRRFLMRLLSKPSLHALAERIIIGHWLKQIEGKLPEELASIHYIGTGWDMFGFALLQAARRKNVSFTVWPAVHPGDWGDDLIDIRLYQKVDRVFAQSKNEKVWLTQKGVSAEKIVVCGLPPMCLETGDGARFRTRYKLSDRPLVLFIGRKDGGKGYPALIEAWKEVRFKFPTACLVTVGANLPGAESSVGQERDSVLDLGLVTEEEKADALNACDIFCLPSAHESFGIVYLEAWSYSKPVICGTAPACRELIENGVDGLWSSQETLELVRDISALLGDPAAARAMGSKGKAKQEEHYTWEKVGRLHLQEFTR